MFYRNSPMLIVFPAQKPVRFRDFNYGEVVELSTLEGVVFDTELKLGGLSTKVESFAHARAIWLAICDAAYSGSEVFYLHEFKWDGK